MSNRRRTINGIVGLIILLSLFAVMAYLLYRLFSGGISSALVAGVLTAASTIAVPAVTNEMQRRREVANLRRAQKVDAYGGFLTHLLEDSSGSQSSEDRSTQVRLLHPNPSFSKAAILWGSDDVVAAYCKLRDANGSPSELGNLILTMRKDLGYENKNLTQDHVDQLFNLQRSGDDSDATIAA